MARLFGKDGVKGIANTTLSCELAFKLGQAAAHVLTSKSDVSRKILVGRDTRISGHMLESALAAGICSMGVSAECVGIIPAPALRYLVKKYKMDAAVCISASHKPMEYNGIKFFDKDGYKIASVLEDHIEEFISGGIDMPPVSTGASLGRISRTHTALRDYVDYVKAISGAELSGMKVAIDCANGAAYECAKLCFKELGADVEMLNNVPNGKNINDNCGSAHIEGLLKYVPSHNCSFGVAFDGDGDHLLACDEKGNVTDAETIDAICTNLPCDGVTSSDGLVTAICLAMQYKKHGVSMSELVSRISGKK